METKFSPEYFISLRGIIKLTQVIVGIVILVLTLVPLTSESVLANGGWRMRYLGALTVSFLMSDIALLYGNLFVFVIKQIIERTYSGKSFQRVPWNKTSYFQQLAQFCSSSPWHSLFGLLQKWLAKELVSSLHSSFLLPLKRFCIRLTSSCLG